MRSREELKAKEDALYEGDEADPVVRAKLDALGFLLGDTDCITDAELDPPQSNEDIDLIIAELRNDRDKVPEYSLFGDPNWRITDAQIQICEWAKGES